MQSTLLLVVVLLKLLLFLFTFFRNGTHQPGQDSSSVCNMFRAGRFAQRHHLQAEKVSPTNHWEDTDHSWESQSNASMLISLKK